MTPPLRILLVDDHALFRRGIASCLARRPDMLVVGEAVDGLDALREVRRLHPDLVIMDISMPRCNGLDALKAIKRERPETRVVMLTVSDDDDDLFSAVKAGAEGYLLKNLDPPDLYSMLEALERGEAPLSPALASRILKEIRDPRVAVAGAAGDESLSSREVEVLGLVTEGRTNAEIAERLFVTENTVKMHLRHILDKLHLQNRVQAAVYGVRRGLGDS